MLTSVRGIRRQAGTWTGGKLPDACQGKGARMAACVLRGELMIRTRGLRQGLLIAAVVGAGVGFASAQAHGYQPGDRDYYGPIVISQTMQPIVIHHEPVIVQGPAVGQPLYVRVPPGHAKKWDKHCAKYHACDRPVYFVDDRWYAREYAPDRKPGKRHGKKHKDDHD